MTEIDVYKRVIWTLWNQHLRYEVFIDCIDTYYTLGDCGADKLYSKGLEDISAKDFLFASCKLLDILGNDLTPTDLSFLLDVCPYDMEKKLLEDEEHEDLVSEE